jgi:aminoglycoside phosphotransferase (APT) family kinase protein
MTAPDPALLPEPSALLAAAGWPEPRSVTRITGGWDTLMWRVVTPDGGAHALRAYRPGPGRDVRGTARREVAALRATAGAGLPVPAVEASGELGVVPFLILSWMPGRPLLDSLAREPWRFWKLGRAFGRLHARLHGVAPPQELRPPTPTIWARRIKDTALADAVAHTAISDTFCHFDFHPLNVLAARGRLSALLDFVNATVADRRADLGVTEAQLVVAPAPPGGPPAAVMSVARRLLARAWRSGYRAEAGDFPLNSLFAAWGAAYYLVGLDEAVRDGRGWATQADAAAVRQYIAAHARAASLPGA